MERGRREVHTPPRIDATSGCWSAKGKKIDVTLPLGPVADVVVDCAAATAISALARMKGVRRSILYERVHLQQIVPES